MPRPPAARLVPVLAALAALGGAAARASGPVADEATALDLLNAERAAHGVRELAWDDDLAALARAHAEDCRRVGIASHHSSGDGAVFADRLDRSGLNARRWAENVAFAGDVLEAHLGFMRSRGHRQNVLDPELTDVGLGVAEASDGFGLFIVEDFASLVRTLPDDEATRTVESALRALPRDAQRGRVVFVPALQREAARLAERMAELDTPTVPEQPLVRHDLAYTYTSTDPTTLPRSLREIAADSDEVGLGLTFRRTPEHPQGTYFACVLLRGIH